MKWTEIKGGDLQNAYNRLMVAFGDRADEIVERIKADEAVARRVAILCLNNGFEPSTSQARAREIMGKNFFGIEEAIKHYGVSPTKRQLAYMAETPYTDEVLLQCKYTHILSAVLWTPIVAVRAKTAQVKLPEGQQRLFCEQSWYNTQPFANDRGQLEWYLVRKTPVPDSARKTWSQQQDLLDQNIEETPTARVMVYTIIGHYLNTGERLFKVWVRCSSLDSGGGRVGVRFLADGLDVSNYSDGHVSDLLGLASSRKSES